METLGSRLGPNTGNWEVRGQPVLESKSKNRNKAGNRTSIGNQKKTLHEAEKKMHKKMLHSEFLVTVQQPLMILMNFISVSFEIIFMTFPSNVVPITSVFGMTLHH